MSILRAGALLLLLAFPTPMFCQAPAAKDAPAGSAAKTEAPKPAEQPKAPEPAKEEPKKWEASGGDTAWLLVSCALVLLMTLPGLALFYGGLVRSKNVLSVVMQCFAMAAAISLQWYLVGYSIAFHEGGIWGGLDWALLKDVKADAADPYGYAATIPHQLWMVFQLMFAIITPALIVGAFAERVKFSGMLVFLVLWSTLVYDPMAHFVWGKGGFLRSVEEPTTKFYSLDFAGGSVVHILSGVSALVCAVMIGKRRGYLKEPMPPHSMVISAIGAGLLWVGWFGFNAGSALGAGPLAVSAFVATHFAAAAAAFSWCAAEWLLRGKASALGAISGAVAGLVAITPACGFVSIGSAILIGLIGGIVCFAACMYLKILLKYDDSLDAFGVHGIGGTWGAIATGLFASKDINPAAKDNGLFTGGGSTQLLNQLAGVGVAYALAIVGTAVLLLVVQGTIGLRVPEKDEIEGLDLTQHGETGYHA